MAGILNAELAFPQFPALDQFGPNTTLLLHGDGTNGAQNNTFLDSSTNNFTITRNGNTTQGTFSPFSQPNGWWSNYFNQTTTSRLKFPSGSILPSSTNFTIECWIYPGVPSNAYNVGIIASQATTVSGDNGRTGFVIQTSGAVYFSIGESFALNQNGKTVPFNQWTHVAVTRSGNTFTMYFNGTAVASASSSKTIDSGFFNVGTLWDGDGVGLLPYQGYISNLRVVGSVVYSSNFTPSTTPLTAISNTNILTCQSNRFLDNSSNAYVPTVTGAPSVQPFDAFSAPTSYFPAVNGGGGYFDGSGDFLVTGTSTNLSLSNSDFTVEYWAYFTSSGNNQTAVSAGNNATYDPIFCYTTGGIIQVYLSASGSSWGLLNGVTLASSFPVNTWHHIAITRTGGNVYTFFNGVLTSTTAVTTQTIYQSANSFVVGTSQTSNYFNGYISGFRFLKGTALYTSTFTVPSSPPTAISNTQLLMNYTNAGIIDSVSQNQLETVGSAQVSTTQSKFGGASMSFAGNGGVVNMTSQQTKSIGSGDFTVEFWMYPTSSGATQGLCCIGNYPGAFAGEFNIYYNVSSNGLIRAQFAYGNAINSVSTIVLNTWTHVAVSRSGGTLRLYLNGNFQNSVASTDVINTSGFSVGQAYPNLAQEYYTGYIDDFRLTTGIGRYTQNFTPPQNALPDFGPLTNIPTVDPNFDNTTLLLHGNGTNGAQNNTFLDSSTNNFTITRNGNTTQGTFTPFSQPNGWWSNYFNGTNSYLNVASNAAFGFGTGDFTIESWVYPTGFSTTGGSDYNMIVDLRAAGNQTALILFYDSNYNVYAFDGPANTVWGGSGKAPQNQWTHVVLARNSGTWSIYINGTSVNTRSSSSNLGSSQPVYIGTAADNPGNYRNLLGYISNLRIVKGTSVYTSNFNPSTLPLTAITNTSLLTSQSNYFKDNSTNAFTITQSGSPTVQNFYPFFPPLDYSTAAIGGSGYFDGAGDFLNTPTSGQFTAAGDFTVSCWFYLQSFAASYYAAGGNWSAGASDEWLIQLANDGSIRFLTSADGTFSSAGVVKLNQWTYFTATRTGTTVTVQVNGTTVRTYTKSDTLGSATKSINIGQQPGNNWPWNGYIADFRLVSGSAVTTIPTTPATAISGTGLLLSCTNGGIFDNASKINPETVSNAQISTTQSKFGGSSMYFDSSGSYLSCPSNINVAFGTGDFTIEYWMYSNDVSTNQKGMLQTSDTVGGLKTTYTTGITMFQGYSSGGNLSGGIGCSIAGTTLASSGAPLTTGAWYHVALVRASGIVTIYVNGNSVASATITTSITGTYLAVGGYYSTSYTFNGYIDDFRITSGVARYRYNFTPPAAPFPNK